LRLHRIFFVGLAVLAGCGGDSDGPGAPDLSNPAEMMLRLSDLPRGYGQGDDRGCGQFGSTEGASPGLDEFLRETRPHGCTTEFRYVWGKRGRSVQSALLVFATPEAARRGWAVRGELFRYLAGVFISVESGADDPGDDAARFDSKGLNDPGVGVVWRDGRLLSVVYEEGITGDQGRQFAADLARKQDAHIRSPEPVPEAEAERDREVGLDDPAIAVPVYWLGREFEPEGFPKLELDEGIRLARGGGPGNDVKIDYSGEGATLYLDLWNPAAWDAFKKTRLGRMVWDSPCARRTDVALDGGHATIFGGYGSGGCPESEPDHWLAHVYLDGVVVTVNMPYCYACGGRSASDPYNSRRGLEAVVRGLRRR
jgi:hypothetical protein